LPEPEPVSEPEPTPEPTPEPIPEPIPEQGRFALFSHRHAAYAAAPEGVSPLEVASGGWAFPSSEGGFDLLAGDFVHPGASASDMLKADLQEWAVAVGESRRGTKAEIASRVSSVVNLEIQGWFS
jgi:hypothetical protein